MVDACVHPKTLHPRHWMDSPICKVYGLIIIELYYVAFVLFHFICYISLLPMISPHVLNKSFSVSADPYSLPCFLTFYLEPIILLFGFPSSCIQVNTQWQLAALNLTDLRKQKKGKIKKYCQTLILVIYFLGMYSIWKMNELVHCTHHLYAGLV